MNDTVENTQNNNSLQSQSPIVTLTTDWGDRQFFAGMVKGALCCLIPEVRVMDITHHVEPFKPRSAAFVIQRACTRFPAGTIHLIDVSTEAPYLVVKAFGQYYICCDNGIPLAALGDGIQEVCRIAEDPRHSGTFASYNLFPRVAAMLASGVPLSDIGEPYTPTKRMSIVGHTQNPDGHTVYIRFIDSYGNAYLGLSESRLEALRQGRDFVFDVCGALVKKRMESYHDDGIQMDPRRRFRLTVSPTGDLELSVADGNFSRLMGRKEGDPVLLQFR